MNEELKREVHDFWESSPCGTFLAKNEEGTREYFDEIDCLRYSHPHYSYAYLIDLIGFKNYAGKQVLEVGCGIGTDLSQFAKNGAIVTGIDLTESAIALAKQRFKVMNLEGTLLVGDAENLPFPDNSFDLVYSFGVLHHTPDTQKAVDEIHRVLKPGGTAKVMLYHKRSIEYVVLLLRKLKNPSRWRWSLQKAISYETEMNKHVGGPVNPLTKTFTRKEATRFFNGFASVRTRVRYINVPVVGRFIPSFVLKLLSKAVGWHVIIEAKK